MEDDRVVGPSVMGPGGISALPGSFTDKIPPAFDGRNDYNSYKQDVQLWQTLTSLPKTKQGAAIIGRLYGEAKSSAKTIDIKDITSEDGVEYILDQLDKSYGLAKTDLLDLDLADFLDFTWNSKLTIEQFIAGFHTRLDKISDLKMDEKLKGHLLLRQSGLDTHTRNMNVGAASGNSASRVSQTPSAKLFEALISQIII